jgi:predicted outer membrane lipoprotein
MGPRVTKTGPADGLEPQLPGIGSQLAAVVARFAISLTEMWRGYPLEGTVVALLLVAGLVYPFPIWLLGFLLWTAGILTALASKFWDATDKWTGLAVPVVVAVVGTVVALAGGGAHDTAGAYAHEIGAAGPPLLRAAIVLGAVYLAWRVRRGPRSSAVPPWNRPHRI